MIPSVTITVHPFQIEIMAAAMYEKGKAHVAPSWYTLDEKLRERWREYARTGLRAIGFDVIEHTEGGS